MTNHKIQPTGQQALNIVGIILHINITFEHKTLGRKPYSLWRYGQPNASKIQKV